MLQQIGHFINSKQVIPSDEEVISVFSPIDGSLLGTVPSASEKTVNEVVACAKQAFKTWSKTPVKERVQVLFRFKTLLETHITELSELIQRENGKTFAEAKAEIDKGIEVLEFV